MSKAKTPTAGRRQGLEMSNGSAAIDSSNPTFTTLENQRHSPVAWLAARAHVALPTARLHAELFGFAGRR